MYRSPLSCLPLIVPLLLAWSCSSGGSATGTPDTPDTAGTFDVAEIGPTDAAPADGATAADVPEAEDMETAGEAFDWAPAVTADAVGDTNPYAGLVLGGPSPCQLGPEPDELNEVSLEPAFPKLVFGQPVHVTHAGDATNRVFVVARAGLVHVFPNSDDVLSSKTFLDITDRVASESLEMGLLSIAFHPKYNENGWFYVDYTAANPLRTRISRFSVSPTDPDQGDPKSEVLILEIPQPFSNHNGGQIAFGPDGKLYVGMGDGGSGGDPFGNGQNLASLLGKILRIDIDAQDAGKAYAVPPDNPFVGKSGAAPEIWALGLRNPWRFTFDPVTGELWTGDVGQNAWEEVDRIEKGKNYGWNTLEGSHCYAPPANCETTGMTMPLAEYSHNEGVSITGGPVYRGKALPGLYGAYIYGDFGSGALWALRFDKDGKPQSTPIAASKKAISTFGLDEAGEVLLADFTAGTLWRFAPPAVAPAGKKFPRTLTETGCFQNVATLAPAAGLVPYDVNSPLWSDGATKRRWALLPPGTQAGYKEFRSWTLPEGALFIKQFEIALADTKPNQMTRLEIRFIVKEAGGVRGYTFRWNDAGTEAFLLTGSATRELALTQGGQTTSISWTFPSRQQCQGCHTKPTGGVLGMQTGQMNRALTYAKPEGPVSLNQLGAWAATGLLKGLPAKDPATLPMFPNPNDGSFDAASRARSYLEVNCSHCHQPGGTTQAAFDARWETPFALSGLCNAAPLNGDLGVGSAKLLVPGKPEQSLLILRMSDLDQPGRMPPFASNLVDALGIKALQSWVGSLSMCP